MSRLLALLARLVGRGTRSGTGPVPYRTIPATGPIIGSGLGRRIALLVFVLLAVSTGLGWGLFMVVYADAVDGLGVGFGLPALRAFLIPTCVLIVAWAVAGPLRPRGARPILGGCLVASFILGVFVLGIPLMRLSWVHQCGGGEGRACWAAGRVAMESGRRTEALGRYRRACALGELAGCRDMVGSPRDADRAWACGRLQTACRSTTDPIGRRLNCLDACQPP